MKTQLNAQDQRLLNHTYPKTTPVPNLLVLQLGLMVKDAVLTDERGLLTDALPSCGPPIQRGQRVWRFGAGTGPTFLGTGMGWEHKVDKVASSLTPLNTRL